MLFDIIAVLSLSSCVSATPIWRPALAGREVAGPSSKPAGQTSGTSNAGPNATGQVTATPSPSSTSRGAKGECSHGAFQCSGQDLQICGNGAWTTIQTCTADQVCAMSPYYNCIEQSYLDLANSTGSAGPALLNSSASAGSNSATSSVASSTAPFSSSSATSPAPVNSSSSDGDPTDSGSSGPGGNNSWTAPHRVIYANMAADTESGFPDPDQLGDFNRLIISVYLADGRKAFDNAKLWAELDASKRQSLLDAYHKRGIAVMFSLFGSTDAPTSSAKRDPTEFADEVANFTTQYGFDGVDADYEDFDAMNAGEAVAWLTPFQKRLREKLPDHLITHAPIAPWFAEEKYDDGAYAGFHKEAGDGVDFYNLQYYNQEGQYEDCESVMVDASRTQYPKTSIKELHEDLGVPLEKLVLGKPVAKGEAASGFMKADDLAQCFALNDFEWPESIMFWQWKDEEKPSQFLAKVLESSDCEEWEYEVGSNGTGSAESSSSVGSAKPSASVTSPSSPSVSSAASANPTTQGQASPFAPTEQDTGGSPRAAGPASPSVAASPISASSAPAAHSELNSALSTGASDPSPVSALAGSAEPGTADASSTAASEGASAASEPSSAHGGGSVSAASGALASAPSSAPDTRTAKASDPGGNWIDPTSALSAPGKPSPSAAAPGASATPAASSSAPATPAASDAEGSTHAMPGAA